jgi:hypothetical protein
MLGCHKSKFDIIFNIHLTNANGDYDGHVEIYIDIVVRSFKTEFNVRNSTFEPT